MKAILLTADYASIEQATGKLNILGMFNKILAEKFPVRHARMAVVVKLIGELGDRSTQRMMTVKLVDEDGTELWRMVTPIQLPQTLHGTPREFTAVIELNGLEFSHSGMYAFSVELDGEPLEAAPIELIRQEQESG